MAVSIERIMNKHPDYRLSLADRLSDWAQWLAERGDIPADLIDDVLLAQNTVEYFKQLEQGSSLRY